MKVRKFKEFFTRARFELFAEWVMKFIAGFIGGILLGSLLFMVVYDLVDWFLNFCNL